MDFMDLLLLDAITSGLARQAAADRARPPPDNFYVLPPNPEAWRKVHQACKEENMVICVEVTDDSHQPSCRVQPLVVELAREVSQIPFFRVKIGFGRTYDQLRRDLGGIKVTPTVLVVFYEDDGVRISSAEGAADVNLGLRTGFFKSKIAEFLETRAKLKLAEKLAEQLAGAIKDEVESRRRQAKLEYERKLREEKEQLDRARRQQEIEEKRRKDLEERQRIQREREQKQEELRRMRPRVVEELLTMDLNSARIRDIKEKMTQLGLSYVGLSEREDLIGKLKQNVPELQRRKESSSSSCTSSYTSSPKSTTPSVHVWQRRAESAENNLEELESIRMNLSSQVDSLSKELKMKDSLINDLKRNKGGGGGGVAFLASRAGAAKGGKYSEEVLKERIKELEDELRETKMLYTTTLEDFSLEGKISSGDGGDGVILRVKCNRPGLPHPKTVYVMKILQNVHLQQTTTKARDEFSNEYRILCKLPPHENIIRLHAFFYDKPLRYPEYRFLSQGGGGMALCILLEELQQNMKSYLNTICDHTSPKVGQYLSWFKDLLSGLVFLESQYVAHRDLKLQNLLMDSGRIKICDFGVAIELDDDMKMQFQQGGVRGGNNAHLAPEVLNARPGRGQYISYSKQPVWAAGVLAYELCGHPSPFDGNTDQTAYTESALPYLKTTAGRNDARATLPAGITKLVHSMLAYDPDKRPSLRDVLRRVSDLA